MRVTSKGERPLAEVAPGVRRAIFFDAPEGARELSMGMAEVDPGKAIPVHKHRTEEGFHVLEGSGVVVVGGEERPIAAGSFCVMPAGEWHMIRNTGSVPLRFVMAFAGTEVKPEWKS